MSKKGGKTPVSSLGAGDIKEGDKVVLKSTASADVRQAFVDFFRSKGHTYWPSSAVLPHDDPTLLFVNAGMNQYKPVFLGIADPNTDMAKLKRAANSQKCIRAGGKHNDLDDVGKDTYHHTFFEMLGNWSFGDYFRNEAIDWAYELLVEVYGLDKERLYVTYFGGQDDLPSDEETRQHWLKYFPEDRVLPFDMKDNFWEMGDTGPCGPCTEIHYDHVGGRNAAKLVNMDDPEVVEIWNVVFMQYNREESGKLNPLPAKHIDTGMGFERITAALQGKTSNYDTDVFSPLFAEIQAATGFETPYGGKLGDEDPDFVDMAYRVIADHIRTITIAVTDGVNPSKDGRGYVLRRILRRAVRYGRQILGMKKPFFNKLVPKVAEMMGSFFPELITNVDRVQEILLEEELQFIRTLDKGVGHFNKRADAVRAAGKTELPVGDVFILYDRYGFPVDLTLLMAEEQGLSFDEEAYQKYAQEIYTATSGKSKGEKGEVVIALGVHATDALNKKGVVPTDDKAKYASGAVTGAKVMAIYNGSEFVDSVDKAGLPVGLVLDKTNFYAEQGGQTFDTGLITAGSTEFEVVDAQVRAGFVLHVGSLNSGTVKVGDSVDVVADEERRAPIKANHTSTHILNFALRKVVGTAVDQRGSWVGPERFRFDFTAKPLKPEQCKEVEEIVNNVISKDLPVFTKNVALQEARGISSVRAIFGETYPDPVRVVSIGQDVDKLIADPTNKEWEDYSVEFCGGTHLSRSSEAKALRILSEDSVAAGVRRMVAVTGADAAAADAAATEAKAKIEAMKGYKGADKDKAINRLADQIKDMGLSVWEAKQASDACTAMFKAALKEKKAAEAAAVAALKEGVKEVAEEFKKSGAKAFVHVAPEAKGETKMAKVICDELLKAVEGSSVIVFSANESSFVYWAATPKSGSHVEGLTAGSWLSAVSGACGGQGGGGGPMGGGKSPNVGQLDAAVAAAKSAAGL